MEHKCFSSVHVHTVMLVCFVEYNEKYVESALYSWSVWTSGIKISEVLLY